MPRRRVDGNANFIILICTARFLVYFILFKVKWAAVRKLWGFIYKRWNGTKCLTGTCDGSNNDGARAISVITRPLQGQTSGGTEGRRDRDSCHNVRSLCGHPSPYATWQVTASRQTRLATALPRRWFIWRQIEAGIVVCEVLSSGRTLGTQWAQTGELQRPFARRCRARRGGSWATRPPGLGNAAGPLGPPRKHVASGRRRAKGTMFRVIYRRRLCPPQDLQRNLNRSD